VTSVLYLSQAYSKMPLDRQAACRLLRRLSSGASDSFAMDRLSTWSPAVLGAGWVTMKDRAVCLSKIWLALKLLANSRGRPPVADGHMAYRLAAIVHQRWSPQGSYL
jgi:hypothetical protein